ncbi:MAG: inositol monophosphatase, partial [Planctomycetaceae bacterium]|nr:inositol monophosphatase [Planctomycetaceae bacterium]
ELLVAALRDADPVLRRCRIEGEEATGDMARFSTDSELAIAIDPIDGTKQYRDRSGNGYSIIVHLHNQTDPIYSLVFAPEMGEHGTWVEVEASRIVCGPDNPDVPARTILDALPDLRHDRSQRGNGIYLIGFQDLDTQRAREVDALGLTGRTSDEMPGSIYPFMATGAYAGSLIHSPNIYDFPVSMQIARVLGGDAVWCHTRQPVHYRELWMDDRAGMLRFPAVVACSEDRSIIDQLCDLAKDWPLERYR